MKKQRLFYLDLIRAVALASILIVHFNATVTGYFTLPHKLFTSTLVQGIYLGDFGSSLFFIVSGASLALTVPPEQSPWQFYKKRVKAVFPLFWLAWVVCFSIRFLSQPGYYTGAKTITLVLPWLHHAAFLCALRGGVDLDRQKLFRQFRDHPRRHAGSAGQRKIHTRALHFYRCRNQHPVLDQHYVRELHPGHRRPAVCRANGRCQQRPCSMGQRCIYAVFQPAHGIAACCANAGRFQWS